jgi:C1A family cysteine protease
MPAPKLIKGLIWQDKDSRDFNFQSIKAPAVILPRVVYTSVPPVIDQEDEGSCVFHGSTEAMEAVEIACCEVLTQFSRQFGYYNYRAKYGDINRDDGAMIRLAVKQLAAEGVCREELWPYTTKTFATKPPAEAYADAPNHKVDKYFAITGREGDPKSLTNDLMACLASGWGFICGINCYQAIQSREVARTGFIPLPDKDEEAVGGHCVYFWGYDQGKKIFWGQNSWGNDWGCKAPTTNERGFFSIPMEYLEKYASDFWTIRMITDALRQ